MYSDPIQEAGTGFRSKTKRKEKKCMNF